MDFRKMNPRFLTRRDLLKQAAYAGALVPLSRVAPWAGAVTAQSTGKKATQQQAPAQNPSPFFQVDEALLEEMENANFRFFWDQANPETGIIRDRCNAVNPDKSDLGSIASTGFGLTSLCIGDQRGYVPHIEARNRALNTMRFLWKKLPNHRGFFYHWANVNTGERLWDSEVSSVDTSILMCGVLTCRQHFPHSEVSLLAYEIFNRIDWTWLSEDTSILPHGWRPESGFLQYRWERYSELMMLYLLGLGSLTHPLPAETWSAWKRLSFEYDGIRYIGSFAPLFVHQYSQAWFDFRGKRDQFADYFQNSTKATEVHRRFCVHLAGQFSDYSESLW